MSREGSALQTSVASEAAEGISLKHFLEGIRPGTTQRVFDALTHAQLSTYTFVLPDLQLHCDDDQCLCVRTFQSLANQEIENGGVKAFYPSYSCISCKRGLKIFSLYFVMKDVDALYALKYGERPAFGPPTPSRMGKLIGSDIELYKKGRRAESQSMGIAALTYYRRIIENQKDRILEEVIKTSKTLGANSETIDELNAAKKETRFADAVGILKLAIPQTLFVRGENPLTLLRSALTDGLHNQDDAECLHLAQSLRMALSGLVERMSEAEWAPPEAMMAALRG